MGGEVRSKASGELHRRGAVIGGEVVPAREAGNVGDVADHGGGDDRAHAEDLGERRPGCLDHHGQLLLRLAQLDVEAAEVVKELGSELAARHLNGPRRRSLLEHLNGFSCGYLFGDAAGEEFADDGVQAAGDLVACPAQVTVALGPRLRTAPCDRRRRCGPGLCVGPYYLRNITERTGTADLARAGFGGTMVAGALVVAGLFSAPGRPGPILGTESRRRTSASTSFQRLSA